MPRSNTATVLKYKFYGAEPKLSDREWDFMSACDLDEYVRFGNRMHEYYRKKAKKKEKDKTEAIKHFDKSGNLSGH